MIVFFGISHDIAQPYLGVGDEIHVISMKKSVLQLVALSQDFRAGITSHMLSLAENQQLVNVNVVKDGSKESVYLQ